MAKVVPPQGGDAQVTKYIAAGSSFGETVYINALGNWVSDIKHAHHFAFKEQAEVHLNLQRQRNKRTVYPMVRLRVKTIQLKPTKGT